MEKFDVAVLGLGGMGKTHAEAAKKSPYVDKIYGYEPDQTRREERAKEIGIIPATLEEIMNNPAIKFVSIAASNAAHFELAEAALRAGKKVMCEKPMGDTLEEATKFIELKNQYNGFLQVGFELHYSTLYMKAKEWIDQGIIGDVVNIQTRYFCCEFHGKNNWRSNSTGSFLIGEKLSHYLDLQRWFMGCNPATVYSVNSPNVVPYFNHHDNHNIVTKFTNGGVGVLNFIMYNAETLHKDPLIDVLTKQSDDGHFLQYLICGTKGAIETDVFRRRLRRWQFSDGEKHMESKIVETITYTPEEDQVWIHNTAGQNIRILELIAQGKGPEVQPEDAYETMRFCFAAAESEATGKIIDMSQFK